MAETPNKQKSNAKPASNRARLSTDPYKGVRDFYPDDMAVQRYIFDIWSRTAESFGYERYDASVLEPAELYRAKGAENEEMVNEQTYTFTDRGDREVTLRPEMTPTVARMVAGRRRELTFPLRWYSIPNLFRYERTQRGRLREHWQLNCDIFGTDDVSADVEIVALAYQTLLNFGADPSMFEIRINNRDILKKVFLDIAEECDENITELQIREIVRLLDRMFKISKDEFNSKLSEIVGPEVGLKISEVVYAAGEVTKRVGSTQEYKDLEQIINNLKELGVSNIEPDPTLARGFDYYTGMIFEIFDTDPENRRSIAGGGRYDNLAEIVGGEPISAVGFAMGDVTTHDFLKTHNLLTADITAPTLLIIPTETALNMDGQKIAQQFRAAGISTTVDMGEKKLGKKLSSAGERMVEYALVFGADEKHSGEYALKNLQTEEETSGTLDDLISKLSEQL